ncbi:C6 transcription factor [Pseudozyma hubeiensis SY62]|uniref:C6 transcription factor n=1 Tax=Pseudozyma hubeiensis (strain SY62) TaxID=1305764 RepID=R9PHR5_PSEHS|nr:C6 transcription factor [Pseudozyma hubeiensis SY62]GAC97655.1 C6 transcription factor [Pseudozyma hubeiensis SY62]
MSSISSGSSSTSGATPFSLGPSSSTSRSPSAEPPFSTSSNKRQRRLTLQDIHIPAGFEIAKNLDDVGTEYPSEENIQKAAEVLQSLRGRMPDGSDGQVAACDYCRRRKIRCDRIKPTCGSCVASGRKCTTEDMLRKRGPPSKKERAILEAAGIIFRGTRPHRRRRTATTSLGSGAASKQQEQLLRKVKEVAGTRTRANSTNSGENAAVTSLADGLETATQSSWMEMLSIATQSANPFADSPGSSPSDISAQDAFHVDAGACDYILPVQVDALLPMPSHNNAPWDNTWATFGADLRNKYAGGASTGATELPNLSAFACNANVDTKDGLFRSPLSSFDAGALDWLGSNMSPSLYQVMYSQGPSAGGAPMPEQQQQQQQQHQHDVDMAMAHVDPQMMVPSSHPHNLHLHLQPPSMQHAHALQSFVSSPTSIAAETVVFQNAMGHFFPKQLSSSASLSNMSSSSSATAEVSTPSELDQFISMGDHHPQNVNQQHQQLQFALSF